MSDFREELQALWGNNADLPMDEYKSRSALFMVEHAGTMVAALDNLARQTMSSIAVIKENIALRELLQQVLNDVERAAVNNVIWPSTLRDIRQALTPAHEGGEQP